MLSFIDQLHHFSGPYFPVIGLNTEIFTQPYRGVFRTQSIIYGGTLLQKLLTVKIIFAEKLRHRCSTGF